MINQIYSTRPLPFILLALTLVICYSPVALCIDRRIHHHSLQAAHSPASPVVAASSAADPSQSSSVADSSSHLDLSQDNSQDPTSISASSVESDPQDYSHDPTEASSLYQAPTDLDVVRLNDTSVVLKWDIPYQASEHLQFFKIQYKSTRKNAGDWKTDNKEIPPTTKAYQINGLRPGNYFFIVSAVYDNDDHLSSDQIKYRLRAKNKIPPNEMPEQSAPQVFWSEAQSDYIRFKWKYPYKQSDSEDVGYLVYYRSAHAVSDFTIYNTWDENVEIAELEPETPYEVRIVAYNRHAVSEFSETITIKTKPKSNTTSSSPSPPVVTTISLTRPVVTTDSVSYADKGTTKAMEEVTRRPVITQNISTPNIDITSSITQITQHKPTSGPTIVNVSGTSTNSTATTSPYQSLSSMIDLILGGQDDTTLTIRYSIIVLILILFIVSASICLISCHHRRKDSPPSSTTNDSMQFDLEINGYFKNSFPGVEKEYSSTTNHHAHHGFVNNHPHISDFA